MFSKDETKKELFDMLKESASENVVDFADFMFSERDIKSGDIEETMVISEFVFNHIKKYGGDFPDWQVGIAMNEERLHVRFGDHLREHANLKHWTSMESSNVQALRATERLFTKHKNVKFQTDGSTGGADPRYLYVYFKND